MATTRTGKGSISIGLRIPLVTHAKLNRICELQAFRTQSDCIRVLIVDFIDAYEKKNGKINIDNVSMDFLK